MTQHLFRNPIDLFPNVDLTQYGVKFGFEFEMILNGRRASAESGNDGSELMEEVSPSLMSMVGGVAGNHTTEYGEHRGEGYTQWHFTGDGSLDPDDEDDCNATPLELVSPILEASRVSDILRSVYSWSHSTGTTGHSRAYTNDSCGLHIGVSADDVSYDNFDAILFSMLVDDHAVLKHCDRLENEYANPFYRRFFDIHSTAVGDAINRPNFLSLISYLSRMGMRGRYSVHASKISDCGYLEYRAPGGNWLTYDLAYMNGLVQRIGTAYLVAAGKITHPMLPSIYNSRLRYAVNNNPEEDFFPEGTHFDIPSIADSFDSSAVSIQTHDIKFVLSDGKLTFHSIHEHSPTLRVALFSGHGSLRDPLTIDFGRGPTADVSARYYAGNLNRASHCNAIRCLLTLREVVHSDPVSFAANLRESVRRLFTGSDTTFAIPADQVNAVVDRICDPYLKLFISLRANWSAFSRTQRNALRAGWHANVSARVRAIAMARACEKVEQVLSRANTISPSMMVLVRKITAAATQAGAPISYQALTNLLAGAKYTNHANSSQMTYDHMVYAQDLRAYAVFGGMLETPQSALRYIQNCYMDFLDPNKTVAVFGQQTSCEDYIALRTALTPLVNCSLASPSDDFVTRTIRAALVERGTRLASALRRAWAITGTANAIRTRIPGRVMREVLVGNKP